MQHLKVNLSQICAKGQSKITTLLPQNDALCLQILIALLALRAFNPTTGMTLRAVARTIGVHHQQIRRRIIGDKHCRSRLKGFVRWENGRGRKGTRVWLSPQGKAVAVGLLACVPFSDKTQIRFFEDPQKWLRLLALLVTDQKRQPTLLAKNGTPTLKNMFRPSVSLKDEDLKVRRESEFKTFVRATTAIFNQPLTRNDFGFRCKVGKTLLAEFPLDAAIGIIRHAQRAWSNATPTQVLRFALKHKEALFEAYLRECERRENLNRIRAVMRPFVAPTEKPKQPPTSPPIKGDRAERAAEIIAADQPLQPIAQRRGKKRCPRCGAEGFELVLKRFDRYYPEVPCPEADRWNGIEVCGYCLKVLRIDEMKAVLAAKSNL
jgi:hypothetical protein